ncbi:unnamed protein product [Parajaminaea phylloscopi]
MTSSNAYKLCLLAVLAAQNCAMGFLLNARPRGPDGYSPASAIFLSECLKVVSSSALAIWTARHQVPDRPSGSRFSAHLAHLWSRCTVADARTVALAAAMFVVQGNLKLFSAPLLTPTSYQILQETRLLFVMAVSVLILRTKVVTPQWIAGVLMVGAVVVMQGPSQAPDQTSRPSAAHSASPDTQGWSQRMGTIGMLLVGLLGAVASVIIEKTMRNVDLWVVNTQLSVFSVLPALAPLVLTQQVHRIFVGFDTLAIVTVLNLAFGGILVALVIKECGNIAKTFATPLAIIPSYAISVSLLHAPFRWSMLVASALAIAASILYNTYRQSTPPPPPPAKRGPEFDEEKGLLNEDEDTHR